MTDSVLTRYNVIYVCNVLVYWCNTFTTMLVEKIHNNYVIFSWFTLIWLL